MQPLSNSSSQPMLPIPNDDPPSPPPKPKPIVITLTSKKLPLPIEIDLSPVLPEQQAKKKVYSPVQIDIDHSADYPSSKLVCPLFSPQGSVTHTIQGTPKFQRRPTQTTPIVIQQLLRCIPDPKDPLHTLLRALFPSPPNQPLCSPEQIGEITHLLSYIITSTKPLGEKIKELCLALEDLDAQWKNSAISKQLLQPMSTLVAARQVYVVAYALETFLRSAFSETSLFFLVDQGNNKVTYCHLNLRDVYKLCPPPNGLYEHLLHAENGNLVASVIRHQIELAYPRVVQIICHEMDLTQAFHTLQKIHGFAMLAPHLPLLCPDKKYGVLILLYQLERELIKKFQSDLPTQFTTLFRSIHAMAMIDGGHFTAPQYAHGSLTGYHLLAPNESSLEISCGTNVLTQIFTHYPRIRNQAGVCQAIYSAKISSDKDGKRKIKPSSFYPFEFTQLCKCLHSCLEKPLLACRDAEGRYNLFGQFKIQEALIYTQILLRKDAEDIPEIMTAYPLVLVEVPEQGIQLDQVHLEADKSNKALPLFGEWKELEAPPSLLQSFVKIAKSQLPEILGTLQSQQTAFGQSNATLKRQKYAALAKKLIAEKLRLFVQNAKGDDQLPLFHYYASPDHAQIVLQASLKRVCGIDLAQLMMTRMKMKFDSKVPQWVNIFQDPYYRMDQVSLFTSWEALAAHFYTEYADTLLTLIEP